MYQYRCDMKTPAAWKEQPVFLELQLRRVAVQENGD